MNGALHNSGAVQIDVYGVQPQTTIMQLQTCATASACRFEPNKKAVGKTDRIYPPFPVQLGTLCLQPEKVPDLVRCLASLAKRKGKEPFSCQIKGRLIDFSRPIMGIRREISRLAKVSCSGKAAPGIVKATLSHRTKTSASSGPHNLEVTT